jgi:hypothetical protein
MGLSLQEFGEGDKMLVSTEGFHWLPIVILPDGSGKIAGGFRDDAPLKGAWQATKCES